MTALVGKNIRTFGFGKAAAIFVGAFIFSFSLRVGRVLSFQQLLLSAVSDHYYLTFFLLPLVLLGCLSVSEDDSEYVIVRFHSYHRYFFRKWLGMSAISAGIILIRSAAILISAVGLKMGNFWTLPADSLEADLFYMLRQRFDSPVTAFFASCVHAFLRIWLIAGLCMWLTHFTGHRWTVRIMLCLYILSAFWTKLPVLQQLPITGLNHLVILHHNMGLPARPMITGVTVSFLMVLIVWSVRRPVIISARFHAGITVYYQKMLMQRRNLWILYAIVLGITAYKGIDDLYLTSEWEWIYHLFSGHGTGIFHMLSFLEMLIVNAAPLYLLAVFIEQSISEQSAFVSIRTCNRTVVLHGLLWVCTQFVALYAVLWILAGIAGGAVFGYRLDLQAFLFLLCCAGMKFLDILLQALVMLICYLFVKQMIVGFLLLLVGNLLCVLAQPWVRLLPFGLSGTFRVDWCSCGYAIPVCAAAAVLVGFIIVLLAWIEWQGRDKL